MGGTTFLHDIIIISVCLVLDGTACLCIGAALLQKLADVWTQFYTSILPTLQAIFVPVQVCSDCGVCPQCVQTRLCCILQLKFLSVRALTLISFRDIVLLKTSISGALCMRVYTYSLTVLCMCARPFSLSNGILFFWGQKFQTLAENHGL